MTSRITDREMTRKMRSWGGRKLYRSTRGSNNPGFNVSEVVRLLGLSNREVATSRPAAADWQIAQVDI